jgi:hypothetical protein
MLVPHQHHLLTLLTPCHLPSRALVQSLLLQALLVLTLLLGAPRAAPHLPSLLVLLLLRELTQHQLTAACHWCCRC